MTVRASGVRGCFIYIPKNTLGQSQGLLHQKPSYINVVGIGRLSGGANGFATTNIFGQYGNTLPFHELRIVLSST
jgi:hypothetical protein